MFQMEECVYAPFGEHSEAADRRAHTLASGCLKNEQKHFPLHCCVEEDHWGIIYTAVSLTVETTNVVKRPQ